MLARLANETAATAATSSHTYTLPTPQPLLAAIAGTNATVTLTGLQRRLQPDVRAESTTTTAFGMPTLSSVASVVLSNFLPTYENTQAGSVSVSGAPPTYSPPSIENLVASSAEDLSSFRDVTFDIFDDEDDLFGSPLAFDASENGLWNGRFVPPPPRPPFFVDEPVLSDGLTTCDLCSWAMPTKSTFIFEGTIEKASELGWPLTLIIVSILSALVGAIIMVTVVRCRRKKASNNRNGKCQQPLKQQPTTPLPSPNHHLHHHHHNLPLHPDSHYHQHNNHSHNNHINHNHHQHVLAQMPLHSHHTAYAPHYASSHYFQQPQPQQQQQQSHQQQSQQHQSQQQQQHHHPRNSCSSSSLTNDSSSSTNHTSLSSIYHPPSYYNNQTQYAPAQLPQAQHPTPKVINTNNISARFSRQKSLPKNINMMTRPLPPQPYTYAYFDSNDEHDHERDPIAADAVSYEEPVLVGSAAAKAVLMASHSFERT